MSERNVILNQLKDDLSKIKYSRGYKSELAKIYRGNINNMESLTKVFPAVYFWNYDDDREDGAFGGDLFRILHVHISGLVDHTGYPGDSPGVEPLQDLSNDIEDFLRSTDWTYRLKTLINKTTIFEYGTNSRMECRIDIMIRYIQE